MSWLIAVVLTVPINLIAASWWPWDYYRHAVTIRSTVTASPTRNCPLETVVTRCASCNTTSQPTPSSNTKTDTANATPSPTCSLSELPGYFFLRMSNDSYLYVNQSSRRAVDVYHSNATAFHVRSTNDGSVTGISQLAFRTRSNDPSTSREYGAWIQTSDIDYGSPLEYFDVEDPPQAGSGYAIVTAGFSTYLCRMSLITWMFHDLSYPLNCEGQLWLGGGFEDGPCSPVNVIVSTGLN